MLRTIFITGTGTGIGKTTTAVALGDGYSRQGKRVAYWKPVSSGQPSDNEIIAQHAPQVQIIPPCYAYDTPISPHAAAVEEKKAAVALPTLVMRLAELHHQPSYDVLLVEGAGGLLVPLNCELQTWLDFLVELENGKQARVRGQEASVSNSRVSIVLVASSGLGTLNHTALSQRCLQDHGLAVKAIVMCGEPFHDNEATVQRMHSHVPVHSLVGCAEFSASQDWSAQSLALTQFIDDSLTANPAQTQAWHEHDQACIWHPFTRYRERESRKQACSHGASKKASDTKSLATQPLSGGCVAIVKASGVWLEDSDGQRMIDGISSWWTNNIGHGRTELAQACAEQLRQCDHVAFAGLTHAPAAQLAHEIVQRSEGHYARVFFSDNGSTAVEVALKIAWQYQRNRGEPQRNTFVALHGGYHGDTVGAMSVSDLDRFRGEFSALLFKTLRLSPVTSHPSRVCPEGTQALAQNLTACQQLFAEHAERLCAIIVEPLVQGAAGMVMQEVAWLQALAKLAAQHDVPLIFDEVFTACGRCGYDFAFQRAGLVPDIVCLAKGLTGGVLPLGLTLTKQKFFDSFVTADCAFMHGHTYTANPIICRTALTALAIARQENLNDRALQLEQKFSAWLKHNHTRLGNPRALGGILAFEVRDTETAQKFVSTAAAQQLYLRPLGDTIYFVPPLLISDDELAVAFHALEQALAEVA